MAKKIFVSHCSATVYVDNYEHGQDMHGINYWDMNDVKGVYASIEDLIKRLSSWGFPTDKEGYSFFSSLEEGVLESGALIDEEGDPVEEGDKLYNDWVAGEIDLYTAMLRCEVSIVEERPMTDTDAEEFGIPLD